MNTVISKLRDIARVFVEGRTVLVVADNAAQFHSFAQKCFLQGNRIEYRQQPAIAIMELGGEKVTLRFIDKWCHEKARGYRCDDVIYLTQDVSRELQEVLQYSKYN